MVLNEAAWLHQANTSLVVGEAPMPTAGPNEIVVRNHAIAINPLDCHMQSSGVFVQQWPAILGCDVAGEVHGVGSEAHGRFKIGDRVVGWDTNLLPNACIGNSLMLGGAIYP
jgi:NADPH:quinone reductase-like Zn-dependent oxidoreductase